MKFLQVYKKTLGIVLFTCAGTTFSVDNWHYYRAPFWYDQPRFETDWFGTLEFHFGGGGTDESFLPSGQKGALFDLYGVSSLSQLAAGIPNLDPNNSLDQLLMQVEQFSTADGFGLVSYRGEFNCTEFQVQGYQNFKGGFFSRLHIPLRVLHVKNLHFRDLSPEVGALNKYNPIWRAFLENLPEIYARYGINDAVRRRAGIGDTSFLVGWSRSHTQTRHLDFVDVALQFGMLAPTSGSFSAARPFDIPLGYNGFWGAPLLFDVAFGAFDWLTVAMHIDALFLFEKNVLHRIKTSHNQSGIIFLEEQPVSFNPGTIWNIGLNVLADHAIRGLSITLGYCYSQADHDCIRLISDTTFSDAVANSDERLKGWKMHTFQILFEYDCASIRNDMRPRVSAFFSLIIGGRRIFDTSVAGAGIGIDYCIGW